MRRRLLPIACITFSAVVNACAGTDTLSPTINLPKARSFWSFGQGASYSGELERGIFKLCTSRIAQTGTYFYTVEGYSDKEGTVAVGSVLQQPGSCTIVNNSKNRGNKSEFDSVRVTYTITAPTAGGFSISTLDGVAVIDESCFEDCELQGFPSTVILRGKEGAIAKFYFLPSGFTALGNHGGTGTIDFAVD